MIFIKFTPKNHNFEFIPKKMVKNHHCCYYGSRGFGSPDLAYQGGHWCFIPVNVGA